MTTKFYTYTQNNSFGEFVENEKIAPFVIIEAHSPEEANTIAVRLGIYFDGVQDDIDCPCCGDRWDLTTYKGDDVPSIYGEPVKDYLPGWRRTTGPNYIIHYLDKSVEKELVNE